MCNLYRRFTPGVAKEPAALTKKTSKREPFGFELLADTEFDPFQILKKKRILPSQLAPPRHDYKYTLDSYACRYQVGCGLLQEQPKDAKLSDGYWSRTQSAAERNNLTTERERFAVV